MVSKRVRHYQNNFTKGEIDPSLWGHGDLSGYYDGVACAENVWINGSGSAVKRYGLARVHSYAAANYAKMYPLDIVSGAHYLIVVTAGHIDVLNGGSGVLVASMDAPLFTEGIVPDLYGLASQDSVIFTHNAVPPQQFKWIGGDNFTLTEIALVNIPSFEFTVNDVHPAATITPSGTGGFIELSSSAAVFEDSDVGKYVTMLPIGRLRIGRVNSGTAVSGFLEENLFDQGAIGSGDWAIERGWAPLWGTHGGYPAVVGFHEGRLIFGNFPHARSVFAYSMINSPFDFSLGDGSAAYGGWRILSYDQGQAICHIISEHALYFFCLKGEYVVEQSSGEPLGRAPIRHDSARGTLPRLRPTTSEDGSLYFFQPNSTSISEFRYYDERGSYEARSMSRYARHLLALPCSAALWQGDKTFDTNILFYVNSDGTMVACTLNLAEKILAFSRITCGHVPLDVSVCGGVVYLCVLEGSGCAIMRFLSGHYSDDGVAYESKITMLPLSNETSAYCSSKITVTAVYAYVSGTSRLKIGGNVAYYGPPITGKFTHYYPSGWTSDGMVTISDDGGGEYWQVNNIARTCLVGGLL